MRILTLTTTLIILFILDAWSTTYLVENVPGRELNPYVDTSSFHNILFSYTHLLILIIIILCWYYAEKNKHMLDLFLKSRSLKLMAYFFPLYFMITKAFAIFNNAMPLIGFSTPVGYMLRPFAALSDDPFTQLGYLYIVMALILSPVLIILTKTLYGEKKE